MYTIKLYFSIASFYVFSLKKTRADDYAGECGPVGVRISEEVPCYINDLPSKCLSSYNDGTVIVKKCRPAYIRDDRKNVTYRCDFDRWRTESEICRPDCGSQTRQNKYPWIVAIYNSNEELICTGTIITTYHVLTAANCFRSFHQNITSGYIVIAGKHYANLQRNKATMQRREIADLTLHRTYTDDPDARMGDIALIEVNMEFVLNDNVRPACVDWDTTYEEWDFGDGNEGIAVGWQSAEANVVPCTNLDSPNIQYWQNITCQKNLPSDYPYAKIGVDKFCAEYIGDDSVCGRDVGSGVFFKSDYRRYFLRGITSVVDSKSDYILYTKVSHYLKWLQTNLSRKYLFSFPSIKDQNSKRTDYGCLLPGDNQYGLFYLTAGRKYGKGQWVPPDTRIFFRCHRRKDNSVLLFQCLNSKWSPPLEKATCRRPGTCPSIEATKSEEVFCNLNGYNVSCEDAQPNTVAVIRCRLFFTYPGQSPVYKCLHGGKWDQTFTPCVPECGLKRAVGTPLLIGAVDTIMNEYPWVVAIYNAMDVHVCGGTIISRHFVLSAAHCFTNNQGVLAKVDDFTVIAGKYFRDIKIKERESQVRKIKLLFIHEDYKASLRKFRDDIALVQVNRAFTLTLEVEPACVDWEDAYEAIDLIQGNKGIVAGWGYTQEGGAPSFQLQKIDVAFQPQDVCVRLLPQSFSDQYATTDKICAGLIGKNTNVCKGDSGGGLYFKSDRSRYFVRGIVSLTVKSETGCDGNQLALYTKVSKYLLWIESITKKVL